MIQDDQQPSTSRENISHPLVSHPPGMEEAQKRTKHTVVEAEKFRASIANPTGMTYHTFNAHESEEYNQNLEVVGTPNPGLVVDGAGLSDNDFFHLTCHIDPNLRSKIEQGAYVDLEKLLPKDKVKNRISDDTRLEWVHRNGGTFLVPANDRENKINGIRHWDQAFRVYATIYCGANPQRSREIWHYVSVINTATASYAWDNVASYDYI